MKTTIENNKPTIRRRKRTAEKICGCNNGELTIYDKPKTR